MNLKDVPNDKGDFKGRGELRKIVYATNEDGSYTTIPSDGWEVENTATKQAWDHVETELAAIREKVLAGELSPIPFYMNKCLMELPVLARYMGKWKWQIKRHFQPGNFKKLPSATLEQYCAVFHISRAELMDIQLHP
jgi:hypothetical protein